jgi:hypothetical protein
LNYAAIVGRLVPTDAQMQSATLGLLAKTPFDPDAVIALTDAYEHACAALGLVGHSDPLNDTIAKMIVERAKRGELDPVRLCAAVLEELRSTR